MSLEKRNIDKRASKGKIASFIGIIVNLILAGCKIAVGVIFGVISVLADGLNNLSDCGSSVISVLSFKLSSRPADKEHPFGHERIEYIFSLVVAFFVLLVAFSTAKESVEKILSSAKTEFSFWVLLALGLSILTKLALFLYFNSTAKKIDSDILKTSAVDCLSDCVSTTVVAISVIIGKFTSFNVDGYAGILVSLFIGWSAIGILKDIFSKLIGQAPDAQMILDIKNKIKSYDGVLDVHDLSVYCYGPNKYFASAHIEVDAKQDVLVSHELIDDIEKDFALNTSILLTGHLDPIVTDNEEVNALKEKVVEFVKQMNAEFSIHDFRLVFGERRTNVLFDVAIPFDSTIQKDQIVKSLQDELTRIDPKYCAIITVEHCLQ